MKHYITLLLPFVAISALSPLATGAVLLDQIGPTPLRFFAATSAASQDFEPAFSRYNVGVIDDFTVLAAHERLTSISAALLGFNGMSNYAAITGYRVEIYSSPAAAATDLIGDLAHERLAPEEVILTTSYAGNSSSALVTLPIFYDLPGAGTYYIAVIPELDLHNNGQIGVYTSADLAGGDNAFQSNPNGGFAYTANVNPLHSSAAYSITSTTIPEPAALLIAAPALAALTRRRL